MSLLDYVKQAYVGKVLTGCEYGMNEGGCQFVTVPQRITSARIGLTEGDHAPCVWLTLENGEEAYFYHNEDIYIQESMD